MIKWSEFREGDTVFEAFLPEHEAERQEWLLRASHLGQIVEERRVRLTWPPRFGPDAGDVAQLQAKLEAMIARIASQHLPSKHGAYMPNPCEIPDSDPHLHAVLYALLVQYVEAERSLGLTQEQSRSYLHLPEGEEADGLYPMAITPKRDGRMRRVIALANMLEHDTRIQPRKAEMLAAVLAEDVPAIKAILAAQGVDLGAEP